MNSKELIKEREMSYKELVSYLLDKYGQVRGNYFVTEKCASKNTKISRTKEGLYIHHIYENQYPRLSSEKEAKNYDYKYQLAENLVYCNNLEHLLLHFLIAIENKTDDETLGLGGCQKITEVLNDYYMKDLYNKKIENCYITIKGNINDYKNLLKWFYNKYKDINKILNFRTLAYGFMSPYNPDPEFYQEIYDYMINKI